MGEEEALLKINEAFNALLSDSPTEVSREVRLAAQRYLDSISNRTDGGEFCWSLFHVLSVKLRDIGKSELPRIQEMRLWCLTVVTNSLAGLPESSRQALADSVWRDYLNNTFPTLWNRSTLCGTCRVCETPPGGQSPHAQITDNDGEELFVLNKLISLLVHLIIIDYPDRLTNAFQVWMTRIAQMHSQLDTTRTMDPSYWEEHGSPRAFLGFVFCFIHLLNTLDVEIIADEAASRNPEERQIAMRIKDGLRLGDVCQIFNFFQTIFDGSLFGIQETILSCAENQKPTKNLPVWWVERCSLALKAMAKIVNWADLTLVVDSDTNNRFLIFWNVAMLNSFGILCADAAFECVQALIYKRMDGGQKCLMLKRSNLVEMFLAAVQTSQPSGLEMRIALTLNTIILQLIEAIADLHKNKDKSGPYKLPMTVEESRQAFKELWDRLIAVTPQAATMIRNTSQWGVAEHLTSSLHEFFRLLKATTRELGFLALAGLKPFLASCLESCLERIRVPVSIDWESTFEKPDEFFLEDEDDGSPESEYFVLRKHILLLFKQVYLLCIQTGDDIASEFQEYIINHATSTTDWRAAEAGMTIILATLDTYKDSSIYPSASVQVLLDKTKSILLTLASLVGTSGCKPPIRQRYFECLGKLSTFYKQKSMTPEAYKEFVLVAVEALLGPAGLRSSDSKKCVAVAIRETLRILRSLRELNGATPGILLPFFDQLGKDNYLTILPVSTLPRNASYGIEDEDDDVSSSGLSLYHPEIPNLALDDQTKLFEIITISSFQPDDKKQVVAAVLRQITQRFNAWLSLEEFEKLNEIQKSCFRDYVTRLLRSIGNLLKGIHRLAEDCTEEFELISRFTMFAVTTLGKSTRIQQNVTFITRRLLACCPETLIAAHLQALLPLLYTSILELTGTVSAWQEKRVAVCLNNVAGLIHAVFEKHRDLSFPRIFSAEKEGNFLFEWCILKHQKALRQLLASNEGALKAVDAAECLQEYHSIFHSIFIGAPTTALLLSLLNTSQEEAIAPVTPSSEAPIPTGPIVQSPTNAEDFTHNSPPTLNALDNLVSGLALGLNQNRNQNFVAMGVKAYCSFLANSLTNTSLISELQMMLEVLRTHHPTIAHRASCVSTIKSRQDLLVALTFDQLRTQMVLRLTVQCILRAPSALDPATGRVILEFSTLLRGLWTGDWSGRSSARLASDPLLQEALLPIQSAALNYLRITLEGGDSVDELIKALIQSDNQLACKDVMTRWLKGIQM
eukprot:Gregarina_sp_Poly_1__735@NODE_1176_length_4862_cov_123_404380_g806_i0_p1_GENE_NODE_1176_length_4862_cov_123_404380_g806_i0NODE_1176_length_4862_cov_123_404380_g806_i0_p1_ORF_typecomplete_len1248_score193_47Xpo1/PF08389_12/4e08Xpo1/PF08389_12/2_7e03Xpo1/PF08389_12/6e03Xpo1/PF08389_12/4_1e03_NODE_1176_length_4862_cov_123_404380_g806_i03514094